MKHLGEPLTRRHFLRGAGACLALPFMETFAQGTAPLATQRFVCMGNPFGMVADAFFPKEAGLAAKLPQTLAAFESLRGKFTVFSNLDHGLNGGHSGTHTFLSGVRTSEASSAANGNVSLDQFLSESVRGQTRFPVLNTSAGSTSGGGVELSWTRSGVMVPAIQKVSQVFRLLFSAETPEQIKSRKGRYAKQGSILDAVMGQADSMNRRLSERDKQKLDEYLTSVREVEKSIQLESEWTDHPKPKVDMKEPRDGTVTQQMPIMLDLILLALESDSTRIATLEVPGAFDVAGVGLQPKGYHAYSHHGKDPDMMKGLEKIEAFQLSQLAGFIAKLEERGMLDSTQVLFGSGMGDGSAHTNKNLPVLLAGGAHNHVTHAMLPGESSRRVPLSNLYLQMAHQFGVDTDLFGRSTGTLSAFQ